MGFNFKNGGRFGGILKARGRFVGFSKFEDVLGDFRMEYGGHLIFPRKTIKKRRLL